MTDEMRVHERILDALHFAGAFDRFAVLLAVLALGISRRLRDLAGRVTTRPALVAKMGHDQLRFVMAHEMGHYVRHHMWKMVEFVLAVLSVALWLAQRLVDGVVRRWGRALGFEVAHDPAAVPLFLLVIGVLTFAMSPLFNVVSRHFEHEADNFSLELTHLNDAGARAFVKFAEDSKVLPDPSPFIRFWHYSPPTLAERIAFCAAYKP
ncbi:MAG TPA: M48 family metalloprotease [Thermoanaerobaculaceae bacterium]|nr:M48 family metalloprotease [Thermoanaerobaculaceae bacterium]